MAQWVRTVRILVRFRTETSQDPPCCGSNEIRRRLAVPAKKALVDFMLDFVKSFLSSPGAASEQGRSTHTRVSLLFLDIDGLLNSQTTREEGDHMPADVLLENLAHSYSYSYSS